MGLSGRSGAAWIYRAANNDVDIPIRFVTLSTEFSIRIGKGQNPMHRFFVVWFLALDLLLPGCATHPVSPAVVEKPVVKPPPPLIRLCGHEVPADSDAVRDEVLHFISPGLPVETAKERMEELGFRCLYGDMVKKKPAKYHPPRTLPELIAGRDLQWDKKFHSLVCKSSGKEIGNWGQYFYPIIVTLPYDENGRIMEVEVVCNPRKMGRYANLLADRFG